MKTADLSESFVQLRPFDQYNEALARRVHPVDWQNPDPISEYNLVVIGGGTAGLVTAVGAAGLGAKVALVERHLLGGDCLNVGCVPSKAWIRSARAIADVRDIERFGGHAERARIDFKDASQRMRRMRAALSPNDSASRLRDLGIDVFFGQASFVSKNSIRVDHHVLRFAKACIATGSRPRVPEVPGLKDVGFFTNETIFSLEALPARLAVLGGGPIGCEMAQALARFGAHVTLIHTGHQILPKDDPDAAALVEQALRRDRIQILTNSRLLKVERGADGKWLAVERDGQRQQLAVDAVLVAIGRTPNVAGMHLETAGVDYSEHSGIQVNDRLQTTNRRIFAAGDCCSSLKFTHAADAMARIVIRNALFWGRARVSGLTIPWCTYTDPELAHVGLSIAEMEEQGISMRTCTIDLADVDRAVLDGEDDGLLKVHIRKRGDRILGATLVARHAGEIISQLSLAISSGIGLKRFAETVFPYPTQAEILKKAADAYNRTRLTPRVKQITERWLRWQRRS